METNKSTITTITTGATIAGAIIGGWYFALDEIDEMVSARTTPTITVLARIEDQLSDAELASTRQFETRSAEHRDMAAVLNRLAGGFMTECGEK